MPDGQSVESAYATRCMGELPCHNPVFGLPELATIGLTMWTEGLVAAPASVTATSKPTKRPWAVFHATLPPFWRASMLTNDADNNVRGWTYRQKDRLARGILPWPRPHHRAGPFPVRFQRLHSSRAPLHRLGILSRRAVSSIAKSSIRIFSQQRLI